MCPLPRLAKPQLGLAGRGRSQVRCVKRRELWLFYEHVSITFNRAYAGSATAGGEGQVGPALFPNEVPAHQQRAVTSLLAACKQLRGARRARLAELAGARALEELVKREAIEAYTSGRTSSSYVPWEADRMSEPTAPEQTCDILLALPPSAAAF